MPRAIFRSLAAVLSGGWVPPLLSVECMERDELADFRRENRQRSGAKNQAAFGVGSWKQAGTVSMAKSSPETRPPPWVNKSCYLISLVSFEVNE